MDYHVLNISYHGEETLHASSSQANLLQDDIDIGQNICKAEQRKRVLLAVIYTTFAASLIGNVIFIFGFTIHHDLDRVCSRYTEQYDSPIFQDIGVSYNTVPFNGSFSKPTIYRQLAGSGYDVDKAWIALGVDLRPVSIPAKEGPKFGLHKGQVKLEQSAGGGFVGYVEAMHHMHCLLMCTADTSIFGQYWVKDVGAWVDFNTKHKCKNYEDVRKWAEERQTGLTFKVKSQPGDIVLSEIP
ncbi:hypothetical protein BT63DRAFT_471365 [Microthyrium microscopicum]|uniref:Uncharacterized protein n=1 Tax=Microthyrium microscopicum TaxID=703497 RepID=A0A6A6U998_9PEZI|nr:hypothetical protein BT63DRAFT_471365 [Microthyrium microscopicum]